MHSARKRRIDEIGEESRNRLLDAAEQLFAEKGYDRTSFIDIAERSGISRGSIPWHFSNKDGLLIAVVERNIERSFSSEFNPIRTLSIRELFRWFGDYVREEILRSRASLTYSLLAHALSSDGVVHHQYKEYFARRRDEEFSRWIRANRVFGQTMARGDVNALATVMNGALLGIQLQYLLDETVNLDASLDMLAKMIESLEREYSKKSAKPRSNRRQQ